MALIRDKLPSLVEELRHSLMNLGRPDVAEQLTALTIQSWTYDPDAEAMYIYVGGGRALNVVERNIIGVKHGECIMLEECAGVVVVDTDNFGRVSGIELIYRKDVLSLLKGAHAP